jgi:hypothetical protein
VRMVKCQGSEEDCVSSKPSVQGFEGCGRLANGYVVQGLLNPLRRRKEPEVGVNFQLRPRFRRGLIRNRFVCWVNGKLIH